MSPHPAALRSLPLATLLATLPWNTLACELPVGRLTAAEGRIEIRTAGSPRWQPATLRQTLCPGDQVAVRGPGRAAVVLGQDVLVRLDQNTTLTLPDGPDAGTMKLPRGVVHVISRFSKRFGVVTPFVNAFVDGTEFTVTAGEDTARVVVAEGRVRTDNREGETRLTAGQAIEARTGSAPAPITMRPLDAVAWAIHYPQVVRLSGTDMADLPESLRAPAILAQQQAARGAFRDALDTLSPLSHLETWPHLTAFKAGILLGLGRSDEAASLAACRTWCPWGAPLRAGFHNAVNGSHIRVKWVDFCAKSQCLCLISSLRTQYGHALEVPRQANQGPFGAHIIEAAQQELTEAHHRFDDSEHRLHGLFAQRIRSPARTALESVLHLFDLTGRRLERRGLLEPTAPVRMVHLAPHRDQRLNLGVVAALDVAFAEIAGVSEQLFGLIEPFR